MKIGTECSERTNEVWSIGTSERVLVPIGLESYPRSLLVSVVEILIPPIVQVPKFCATIDEEFNMF